jgi:predicted DNA-binding transcriptional regulator AlpA
MTDGDIRLNIFPISVIVCNRMKTYSTLKVAKMLGISRMSLQRYIAAGKISAPKSQRIGGMLVRPWTSSDIRRVRKELPGIKNGRKKRTRK